MNIPNFVLCLLGFLYLLPIVNLFWFKPDMYKEQLLSLKGKKKKNIFDLFYGPWINYLAANPEKGLVSGRIGSAIGIIVVIMGMIIAITGPL